MELWLETKVTQVGAEDIRSSQVGLMQRWGGTRGEKAPEDRIHEDTVDVSADEGH